MSYRGLLLKSFWACWWYCENLFEDVSEIWHVAEIVAYACYVWIFQLLNYLLLNSYDEFVFVICWEIIDMDVCFEFEFH